MNGPSTAENPARASLLTADDVAALLQVPRSWVYAEVRAGRIPHVTPGRRPASISAWRRQLWIAWVLTPRSAATSLTGLPAFTSSRTRRRNSGGYLFGMALSFESQRREIPRKASQRKRGKTKVSSKAGQLQAADHGQASSSSAGRGLSPRPAQDACPATDFQLTYDTYGHLMPDAFDGFGGSLDSLLCEATEHPGDDRRGHAGVTSADLVDLA